MALNGPLPILANAVRSALAEVSHEVLVIDPAASDTAEFCATYGWRPDQCANTIVVEGRTGADTVHAMCIVLATCKVDVNRTARSVLGVRKLSFAARETAVTATGMEFGAITPFGAPTDWPILVDAAVAVAPLVLMGAGVRSAKVVVAGSDLATLPGARLIPSLGLPTR